MSGMNTKLLVFTACVFGVLLSSCAAYRAPAGWLPDRDHVGAEAFGGWIYIEEGPTQHSAIVQGEFIGIRDSALYVLSRDGMVRAPFDQVRYAQLRIHDVNSGGFVAWAMLGTVSALFTHGWYAGASLPVWIAAWIGAPIAESASGEYKLDLRDQEPSLNTQQDVELWTYRCAIYSRFPQGIPASVNLNRLSGKR